MNFGYTTEDLHKSISVQEYVEKYVDVPTFLEYCKVCDNYEKQWACPSFDFDVMEYWNQYEDLDIVGIKINYDKSMLERTYSQEELLEIYKKSLWKEKRKMSIQLMEEEKKYPGSISLSAGSCQECEKGNCTRKDGKPCRYPERMRYSIEALGGDVGRTASKLLGVDLEWVQEGQLPAHFVLVGGLLRKD